MPTSVESRVIMGSIAATPPLIMVLTSHPLALAIAIAVAVNVTAMVVTRMSSTETKCLWQPSGEKNFSWVHESDAAGEDPVEQIIDRPIESAIDQIERVLGPHWARCLQCLPGAQESARQQQCTTTVRGPGKAALVGVAPTDEPQLTDAERARVRAGKTVISRLPSRTSTTSGLAVQRVRAPADVVWGALTDFARWPQMVPHCCETTVYEDTTCPSGGERGFIDIKTTLGVAFVRLAAHIHQTVDRSAGRITWTLDEEKSNDCVTHTGFWLVRPDPADESATLVYYSADVQLCSWCPGWLNAFVAEQGLPLAVGWLRREAEKRLAETA